jgi:hypothetical protein
MRSLLDYEAEGVAVIVAVRCETSPKFQALPADSLCAQDLV